jgi:hypothetical protein
LFWCCKACLRSGVRPVYKMQTGFWQTFSSVTHYYKDDRVLLVPALRFVFDAMADQAIRTLRTVLLQHSAFADAITSEPTNPDTETVRRRDLLQLCWVISNDKILCQSHTCPDRLRRDVVSRFYTLYGGDPVWLLSLFGWTFPDLPHVEPSLLGLTYLYEDDSLEQFRVYDSVDGKPFYLKREDAHQLMDGVMRKVEECPSKVITALSNQDVGTLTRKEAWQMARAMGKDIAQKRRLADALQSA